MTNDEEWNEDEFNPTVKPIKLKLVKDEYVLRGEAVRYVGKKVLLFYHPEGCECGEHV